MTPIVTHSSELAKRLVLIAGLLGMVSLADAAPSIESVVPSPESAGQVLQVNGSGFADGPTVILFDDFESGQLGDYVLPTSPKIGAWNDLPESGAKPFYVQESTTNKGFLARDLSQPIGSQRPILKLSFGKAYREVFLSFSVKVPEDSFFSGAAADQIFPDRSSWKYIWLMSGEGLRSADGLFDLAIPSHVGGGSFLIGGNDGTISWISGGANWWAWHDFNNMAFHLKIDEATPPVAPVQWAFETVSTKNTTFRSGTTEPSEFATTDYQFDKLHVPGWWGNGDTSNFQAIYDNVYVAAGVNSQARIIATNGKSWQESTMSVTLPAQTWSDNQITIDFDLVPKWSSVYFHVVDAEGNRSPTGVSFCPLCPAPVNAELN